MPATVVVGTQWGDEGKGKFTDLVAKEMELVVRYQGGHNAGHTFVVDGESFALQLVPREVYDHITPVIGNGVVVDPRVLISEMDMLESRRRHVDAQVSGNAHLIMPYHQLDALHERNLGEPSSVRPSAASAWRTPTRRCVSVYGSRISPIPRSSGPSLMCPRTPTRCLPRPLTRGGRFDEIAASTSTRAPCGSSCTSATPFRSCTTHWRPAVHILLEGAQRPSSISTTARTRSSPVQPGVRRRAPAPVSGATSSASSVSRRT